MKTEFDNNIPIYLQLVSKLKFYIISGKISPGDRLPSVRDLAFEMKVNPNTMQKALVELENIGLIYTERTNGKFITNDQKLIDKLKREQASDITEYYIEKMENLGFTIKEVIECLKDKGEKE